MTAMSNEMNVICINERNYRKKQPRHMWHELCSMEATCSVDYNTKNERG